LFNILNFAWEVKQEGLFFIHFQDLLIISCLLDDMNNAD